jgi:hypothetical protein
MTRWLRRKASSKSSSAGSKFATTRTGWRFIVVPRCTFVATRTNADSLVSSVPWCTKYVARLDQALGGRWPRGWGWSMLARTARAAMRFDFTRYGRECYCFRTVNFH